MADLLLVVVTALLSAALTGAVLYWLWSRRVFPELEVDAFAPLPPADGAGVDADGAFAFSPPSESESVSNPAVKSTFGVLTTNPANLLSSSFVVKDAIAV